MKYAFLSALPAAALFLQHEAFAFSSVGHSAKTSILVSHGYTSSFVGTSSRSAMSRTSQRHSSVRRSKAASVTRLSMVIDRMSNECVSAIQTAHDIGNSIGLKTLRNEILFCGMINKPERAAKTLQKYNLNNPSEIESAAIRTLQFKLPTGELDLKGENRKEGDVKEALPFSEETRSVLNKACEIADRMESETVRSEHVILALMGYNNGNPIENVPILDLLGDIPSLKQGNRETSGFRVTQFCQELVNALPNTPVSDDGTTIVRDTVVVGGRAGGGTSTLNDVGVDLTQMALEGKLDMVFGRDKEIKSALRTLGRRRKNNPCLIGDPGVGTCFDSFKSTICDVH
jgi:ATP-dependent Clp protease ATP-binding subunit ClpC